VSVEPVVLARLGETVDEVVVVETDKVEVEVESPFPGTVTELLVAEGDEVPTGAALCLIATAG